MDVLVMGKNEDWKSIEAARHHSKTADILVPGRRESLSIIARLATLSVSDQPRILDIGCGYGDFTMLILQMSPLASVCMVDFSGEMIQLARKRFSINNRVKIIKHDLNNGIPDRLKSDKFDAVVSCHALHHIEHENKVELYTQINLVLDEGDLFINCDRYIGESPVISRWEFDNWVRWEAEQIRDKLGKDKTFDEVKEIQLESDERLGDMPGTLWDTQRDLKQAGFQYIDCVWKNHNMGIVVATK
ncbi:class I SAM-dependent methyltransferase [Chloroflexota bacterium]